MSGPTLAFRVLASRALPHAAGPTLGFTLQLQSRPEARVIHSVALQCQLRIAPLRREYGEAEKRAMVELFGTPGRWGKTVPPTFLWTQAQAMVPGFSGGTEVELPVPCTLDFNVGATKYFKALQDGVVPLVFLFSGTLFFQGEEGRLQASPVPWSEEAEHALPVAVWASMMDCYFPDSGPLLLRRDVLERLHRWKVDQGLLSVDRALEALLDAAKAPA